MNKKRARKESIRSLEDALAASGYFGAAEVERAEFSGGDVSALWRVPRCANGVADPVNDLDVAEALLLCEEALHHVGVHVSIRRDEEHGNVAVDERSVSLPPIEETTGAAVVATLEILDELCARAGVPERAFFANVSDGVVLFLTPDIRRAFEESDLLPAWQKPWKEEEPEEPPSDPWLRLESSWMGCVAVVLLFVMALAFVVGGMTLLVWLIPVHRK